ncbi:unnamed protein product, partial [marine sediment metagenome]
IREEIKYINNYLPEIKNGGLKILDIGCGFGVFLELARYYKCDPIGTHYDYSARTFLYNDYCELMFNVQNLNIINLDLYNVIKNDDIIMIKDFDIINCKHAINLIFLKHFDFKKNCWILSNELIYLTDKFFILCNDILNNNGILMIASLTSKNRKKYTNIIKDIAKKNNFKLLINNRNLNYKFIKQ